MNEHQLRRLFPNASRSTVAANAGDPELFEHAQCTGRKEADSPFGDPELERCPTTGAVGASKAKAGDSARLLVRVTKVSRRLIDEDNLCEKFVLDCCRYNGWLPGDSPAEVRIEARQRKAAKGEEEHTVIEIFEL